MSRVVTLIISDMIWGHIAGASGFERRNTLYEKKLSSKTLVIRNKNFKMFNPVSSHTKI